VQDVVLGPKRTPTQDVEFSIHALVEIAARALSPGINDPRTAMTCIDRLTAALAHMMRFGERSPLIHDRDGTLRLITKPTTFEEALDAAFSQIRQAANGHVSILLRLIEGMIELAAIAATERRRGALARLGPWSGAPAAVRSPSTTIAPMPSGACAGWMRRWRRARSRVAKPERREALKAATRGRLRRPARCSI
jgi:hypothetical protein